MAVGRQQFTIYTGLTFFTSLACQWFTCLLTLVYENTTCFGVSSCRLLSLGEGGGFQLGYCCCCWLPAQLYLL